MNDRDKYKKEYTTLGIACAGVYATVGDNVRVSIPDTRLSSYYGDLVEGGYLIDKRPCIHREDFVHMVVSGPLLKESLPYGHKEGWDRKAIPVDPEGEKFGSLDYVSLDVYLDLWRKAGAKIGVRKGNKISWEDGSQTLIPNEKDRWLQIE